MANDLNLPAGTETFLAAHGWGGATVVPLAGDASFRRYFRVAAGDRRAILMDAPPPHEDPRPFVAVARWLTAKGFAAPAIHAADEAAGLVLLEDFGDDRMRETVDAAPEREAELYASAVETLIALGSHDAGDVPPYDRAVYQREAALFVEYYCPAIGLDVDVAGYRAAWDEVLAGVLAEPRKVTVLRDYHAENLMLVAGRGELGLLDFQDALAGHPAYDLVSLLQDARRDVPQATERAMLARYKVATGAGEEFDAAYWVLGAQRNAKIVGIFTRLWWRDGKPRYPALCPRVWRYLERDLMQPALAPVRSWFDANVPPDKRGDPMVIAGAAA
ncbi:MAG: phosphotransferase [Pseudomonadota bacterium]